MRAHKSSTIFKNRGLSKLRPESTFAILESCGSSSIGSPSTSEQNSMEPGFTRDDDDGASLCRLWHCPNCQKLFAVKC